MRKNDFDFDLPEHLIAQRPTERRGQSRLLLLDKRSGAREHRMVEDLPEILCGPRFALEAGPPLLVFNNSKVLKARLPGADLRSGARAEFLLLEKAGDSGRVWKALAQKAKRRRPGSEYALFDPQGKEAARARVLPAQDGESGAFGGETRLLEFDREIDDEWLEANGRVPLPPYIKRSDEPEDARRYQTVYARAPGSAAAPTAGLHFTDDLLGRLARAGIESAFVTLHVGLGTFLPVRADEIKDHAMHEEQYEIGEDAARAIEDAKAKGRKVIAVGTTSARALESAWIPGGGISRGKRGTSIFIYPGFTFNVIDALFTNFHTPQSTLLMLVSAFVGRELALESYAEAVREEYRFFSYGDAMLAF